MISRTEPSTLGAAARLVLRSLRERSGSGPGPEPRGPRRRVAVERRGLLPEPRRVRAYLAATGGDALTDPWDAAAPLPPVYPAVWETALTLDLLGEAGLGLPTGGLVHLGGEMVRVRPLLLGEPVRCRMEIDGADPVPGGVLLTLLARNWNPAGQLCQEDVLTLLARDRGRTGGGSGRTQEGDAPESGWEELESWALPPGEGRRYARVSGDYNPIHLWGWSSRLLGFRGPILHGYCTQARVAHALIRRVMGGDPMRLRRLEIQFRAPIALPMTATLEIARREEGGGWFRVAGRDGASRPLATGTWVGQG